MKPPRHSFSSGKNAIAIYALLSVAFGLLVLSMGTADETLDRVVAIVFTLLNSAWLPILYLIGALGLGQIARRWTAQLPTRLIIELCIGLTITLSLTHILGITGMLNPITAWLITGTGCLLVARELNSHLEAITRTVDQLTISIPGIAFVFGCVLVVLMSCNPPGISWDSEFGGYDALSYHLQLPREWLELERIWPSEHNVYSFLPGYIESAYLHFAHLADTPGTTDSGLSGFLANDARIAMSAHLFSSALLIISAMGIGAVTKRTIALYLPESDARFPALCAQALFICTPWLTIVGSLAYNETGVVLLGIGALALALEREHSPNLRALLIAFLVAGACSCKPTAIFLLAPTVGVVFLSTIPVRHWIKPISIGIIVGLLTLSPWLIRNQLATNSLVFPQLSSLFGDGHWSDAQHTVYADAHHFEGSFFNRLTMLALPDPTGTTHTSSYRGFTNIQWALAPWTGLIGCLLLLIHTKTRKLGIIASVAIVLPIVGWLTMTHLQSRFLIPITPALIIAGALGLASMRTNRNQLITTLNTSIISIVSIAWGVIIVSIQLNSNPFVTLILGSRLYTGEIKLADAPWSSTLNTLLEPHETVYLLGDAAPFYVRSPVVYNTIYDHWLIEYAINAYPNEPSKWSAVLREHNIDVVLIASAEIRRFEHSGWLPETINTNELIEWIKTLPEPIYVWTLPNNSQPIRAAYRLPNE